MPFYLNKQIYFYLKKTHSIVSRRQHLLGRSPRATCLVLPIRRTKRRWGPQFSPQNTQKRAAASTKEHQKHPRKPNDPTDLPIACIPKNTNFQELASFRRPPFPAHPPISDLWAETPAESTMLVPAPKGPKTLKITLERCFKSAKGRVKTLKTSWVF